MLRPARFAAFLLMGFAFAPAVFALTIPAKPDGYVTDKANMISAPIRKWIETQLLKFENETSNQIVVVTFPSLEGASLEDFSIRLAQQWKIGQKDKNNGVIFLIFKNDRKMRIEVGYGLEGALTDALASSIIRDIVAPKFREGKYDEGIGQGVSAIIQATRGEYRAPERPVRKERRLSGDAIFTLLGLSVLAVIVILDFIRYGFYFLFHLFSRKRYSFMKWWIHFAWIYALTKSSGSGGSWSSGSSGSSGGGGGFSGGGGSFGGGGSSGGW